MARLTVSINCFFMLSFLWMLSSCNSNKNIPFPGDDGEYENAVTRSFELPAAKKIDWAAVKIDTVAAPLVKSFDIDKLPSKPFYIDGFKPFDAIPAQEKTNWKNLQASSFDIDTITKQPLVYKNIKVNAPVKIKAGIAKTKLPVSTNITQFGQEEGLPGGVVHQIFKDSKGIYWIVTGKGLCRYDGEYFEVFSFIEKEPQGNIAVAEIAEDKYNRIWLRTQTRATYIFDYRSGIVKKFPSIGYNFCSDNAGRVWMLANDETITVDPLNFIVTRINNHHISDSGIVTRIMNGQGNELLVRTLEGISIIDPVKKTIRKWNSGRVDNFPMLYYFLQTRDKKLITGTNNGIDVLDPSTENITHITNKEVKTDFSKAFNILEDNKGRFWITRPDSAVAVLDSRNNKYTFLQKEDGLSENNITSAWSDDNGQVWLGTSSGGINIINTNLDIHHLSTRQGLNDNEVWGLQEDDLGNIWVGAKEGINIINTKEQTIKSVAEEIKMGRGYVPIPKIAKTKDNVIWALSRNNALSAVD